MISNFKFYFLLNFIFTWKDSDLDKKKGGRGESLSPDASLDQTKKLQKLENFRESNK